MNKKQFAKLCMNYDKEPNEELYSLWNEMLEDYDPYFIEVAIDNIIQNDKFFPTYSRVLEVLNNIPPMEIPEEEKIKRMKNKGVIPEWFNKEIPESEIEEDDEFKTFIEGFRNGQ